MKLFTEVVAYILTLSPIDLPEPESEIPMLLIGSRSLPTTVNIQSLQLASAWWKSIILGLREPNPPKETCRLIRNFILRDRILFHRIVRHGHVFYRLSSPFFDNPSLVGLS